MLIGVSARALAALLIGNSRYCNSGFPLTNWKTKRVGPAAPAFDNGTIDVADNGGPAVYHSLGFSPVISACENKLASLERVMLLATEKLEKIRQPASGKREVLERSLQFLSNH